MEEQLLNDTKALLNITDNAYDAAIGIIINQTAAEICAYCRLEELPSQLFGIAAMMCADEFRNARFAGFSDESSVKSVSEGDVSVTYNERDIKTGALDLYKTRLEPFRNKMGRLPYEIE